MNVLIIGGGGTSGAWAMRGEQLGAAMGARVTAAPIDADLAWAHVVIVVKRIPKRLQPFLASLRASGKPFVWDILDIWRQPDDNALNEYHALGLLRRSIADVSPTLVIGATERMAADAGGVCLPHHQRLDLQPKPVRELVTLVAYEGSERYLGRWQGWIEAECQARGWRFVINPPDLAAADLVVAFRDAEWDGWMSRHWKSGVKLSNAMGALRPVIGQWSAAWEEMQPAGSIVETPADLRDAFDHWSPRARRRSAAGDMAHTAPAYLVDTLAARYRAILAERISYK